MPIYEYRCKCGSEKEVILPIEEYNQPQVCECGEVMQRKMSVPRPAIFVPTGRGMALDSLNSKAGGFPDCDLKSSAQQKAFEGIDSPKRIIGKGFG